MHIILLSYTKPLFPLPSISPSLFPSHDLPPPRSIPTLASVSLLLAAARSEPASPPRNNPAVRCCVGLRHVRATSHHTNLAKDECATNARQAAGRDSIGHRELFPLKLRHPPAQPSRTSPVVRPRLLRSARPPATIQSDRSPFPSPPLVLDALRQGRPRALRGRRAARRRAVRAHPQHARPLPRRRPTHPTARRLP